MLVSNPLLKVRLRQLVTTVRHIGIAIVIRRWRAPLALVYVVVYYAPIFLGRVLAMLANHWQLLNEATRVRLQFALLHELQDLLLGDLFALVHADVGTVTGCVEVDQVLSKVPVLLFRWLHCFGFLHIEFLICPSLLIGT